MSNITEVTTFNGNKVSVVNYFLTNKGCQIKVNSKNYTYNEYIQFKQGCCKILKERGEWYRGVVQGL